MTANIAILGRTAYPLMGRTFVQALGPGVKVCSLASLVAERLADCLQRHPGMLVAGATAKFLTTGEPRAVSDRARHFLRRRVAFERA